MAANKKLILAEWDSTVNDIPGANIQSFPTVKFFKGNDKANPIDYQGDRTE